MQVSHEVFQRWRRLLWNLSRLIPPPQIDRRAEVRVLFEVSCLRGRHWSPLQEETLLRRLAQLTRVDRIDGTQIAIGSDVQTDRFDERRLKMFIQPSRS